MTEPGMAPESAEVAPDAGAFGAVAGALVAPEKTFASLSVRPRWVLPLLILVGAAVALSLVVSPRMDMEKAIRDAMERSGQEVDEEMFARQVELAEKFAWVGGAMQLVIQPVIYLVAAALYLALFRMLGSEIDFRRSFSTTLHALLPVALFTLLSVPVVLSRSQIDAAEAKSGGFLPSNLAIFAPEGASAVVRALLGSVDLFTIWSTVLLAIGYRVVAKVSRGQAWGVVGSMTALFVLGRVALTGLF